MKFSRYGADFQYSTVSGASSARATAEAETAERRSPGSTPARSRGSLTIESRSVVLATRSVRAMTAFNCCSSDARRSRASCFVAGKDNNARRNRSNSSANSPATSGPRSPYRNSSVSRNSS